MIGPISIKYFALEFFLRRSGTIGRDATSVHRNLVSPGDVLLDVLLNFLLDILLDVLLGVYTIHTSEV